MYTKFTHEPFYWTGLILLGFITAAVYVVTFQKFTDLRNEENMGFGITMPPTDELMFMNAMINDINLETINIALLLSMLSGLTWFRVIMALQVTETFGPLITAIFRMVIDIL